MKRNDSTVLVLAVIASVLIPRSEAAAEKKSSHKNDHQLEVALHYDFYGVQGMRVSDQAKQKHEGTIQDGQIVQGKRKPAVKLDGRGSIIVAASPADLDPAQKAFSVGALCQPAAPDGVLVAMGTEHNGFRIFLREGVPHFSVCSAGETTTVAGDRPVATNQWLHLMGTLDTAGQLSLVVNGWPTGTAQGKLITETPEQPLCIGADCEGTAGTDKRLPNWTGLLEDIRLYWGVMDRNYHRDDLGDWADLPGCGCK
ncbi:MAG: LamG-like jellyroll fold domain-containing protein [Pirellulaceae bacterium]